MSGGEKANKNCITIDDYSFPCLTNYPRSCSTRVLLDTIRHKDPHSRYRRGSMNIYLLYGSDRYLHSLFLPFSPPRSSIFIGRSRHKVEPLRIHQVEKERVKGSAPLNKRRSRNSQLSLSQHLPLLWSILLFLSFSVSLSSSSSLVALVYSCKFFCVHTRVYIIYYSLILRFYVLFTCTLVAYTRTIYGRIVGSLTYVRKKETGYGTMMDEGMKEYVNLIQSIMVFFFSRIVIRADFDTTALICLWCGSMSRRESLRTWILDRQN